MRAILADPSQGVRLAEIPPPPVGPGEVLVEMRVSGLCGTDLAKLAHLPVPEGIRLGHELAGVVRTVGPGVSRVAPGDRVTAAHHVPCGACSPCRHGNESMCPQFKATHLDPCGFAELIRFSRLHVEQVMFRLPDDMDFEVASFAEPLACAVRAVERSRVLPGDRVAVVGAGGMGLLIAQVLLARRAEPVVLDVAEPRLALARTLGVPTAINPARQPLAEALASLPGGSGLDGAILTVTSQALLADLQPALRPGGVLNVFAGPAEAAALALDIDDLYHRELTLLATYSSTPATLAEAFRLLADRRVQVLPLISHRLPLAAFAEGVRLQRQGRALKVLFHP